MSLMLLNRLLLSLPWLLKLTSSMLQCLPLHLLREAVCGKNVTRLHTADESADLVALSSKLEFHLNAGFAS